MKIPNITGLMKVGKTFIMANRPEILFGASITATLASVILAAKGGYEARGIVIRQESIRANNVTGDGEIRPLPLLTAKEKFQLTWLCYMPAMATTVTAIGSTTGLHLVHVKEKKMLAQAALAAIEEIKTSAKEFEKESLGVLSNEEKDKVLTEREKEDGVAHIQDSDHQIEELYLVRDGRSGRDIWSNQHRIEEALNSVNVMLNRQGDCELNTFYGAAGFELLFPEGDDWGWSGDLIELAWKTDTRDDGRPVRRFDFRKAPQQGFCGAN